MEGMKQYEVNGRLAWYWPKDAPKGAVEVKAKAKKPANKARKVADKAAEEK